MNLLQLTVCFKLEENHNLHSVGSRTFGETRFAIVLVTEARPDSDLDGWVETAKCNSIT